VHEHLYSDGLLRLKERKAIPHLILDDCTFKPDLILEKKMKKVEFSPKMIKSESLYYDRCEKARQNREYRDSAFTSGDKWNCETTTPEPFEFSISPQKQKQVKKRSKNKKVNKKMSLKSKKKQEKEKSEEEKKNSSIIFVDLPLSTKLKAMFDEILD